ncbi:hypothetical protein MIZ01_1942 [Sideroxyarcus emersonii]|uniref:Uncharacterized protein n=1 Tax=Sideroxyarcus emersonii TaxID=2764705 RepID=A0AAN1XBC8_9PROT|nr:hypothetical protein MIZ01_1942 [Sideroxyarcus emersonii]
MKLAPPNLLRSQSAALRGARSPHVLHVHSGSCAPCALYFGHS